MGAIDIHLRKLLPSSFVCWVQHQAGKALSLKKQVRLLYCDQLKVHYTYVFHRNILILLFLVLNQQCVLDWVVNTLSFKLTEIIILC